MIYMSWWSFTDRAEVRTFSMISKVESQCTLHFQQLLSFFKRIYWLAFFGGIVTKKLIKKRFSLWIMCTLGISLQIMKLPLSIMIYRTPDSIVIPLKLYFSSSVYVNRDLNDINWTYSVEDFPSNEYFLSKL